MLYLVLHNCVVINVLFKFICLAGSCFRILPVETRY